MLLGRKANIDVVDQIFLFILNFFYGSWHVKGASNARLSHTAKGEILSGVSVFLHCLEAFLPRQCFKARLKNTFESLSLKTISIIFQIVGIKYTTPKIG